jgi:hypothetical protein
VGKAVDFLSGQEFLMIADRNRNRQISSDNNFDLDVSGVASRVLNRLGTAIESHFPDLPPDKFGEDAARLGAEREKRHVVPSDTNKRPKKSYRSDD